jgi:putative ABC transport system permease protein
MHIRSTIRSLLRMPSFALAVVLTIALGVGATSAMFSVVYAVLLRPLPYPDADQLVVVWEKWQVDRDLKGVDPTVAAQLAERSVVMTDAVPVWRKENHVFQDIGGFNPRQFSLTGTAEPERIDGMVATSQFFRVLGTYPVLGRAFTTDEDQPGQDEVVILGHGLWMRRFGGDRNIIGKAIGIDGLPHIVIGVMPADFHLVLPNVPRDPQLITPVPHSYQPRRKWALLMTVARLKPGIGVTAAQADMSAVIKRMAETNPRYRTRDANVVPLADEMAHDSRLALLVLFGATGCVLLIGCVNVANLLLLRAAARQKELAIRTALGAGRWPLARHVIGESLALASIGGIAGLVIAYWGTDLLVALVPKHLFPRLEDVRVDPMVLGFGFAVSVVVGVVAGLVPAWHTLRWDRRGLLNRTLNDAQRTSTISRSQRATRRALVTAQVAIAMALLVGAGLLAETYVRLTRVDLGVSPERVLTFGVILPPARYGTDVARVAFEDALVARLEALPGVAAVGLTNSLPVHSSFIGSMSVAVEGRPPADREFVEVRTVNPGFFRAAGTRLAYGRFLGAADVRSEVTVVNRALVRRYWPAAPAKGSEPLGRKLRVGDRWCTIIGVVDDVKYAGPDRRSEPDAYVPLAYWPTGYISALVRAQGDPMALARLTRQALRAVDPDLPMQDVRTMEEVVSESVAPPRFRFVLIGIFAALALVLAAIGLYGVISQSVAHRRQEIGIRMALGAARGAIARMVLIEGLALAAIGIVVGIAVSLAATRVLAGFLFGVTATNVSTYAIVALAIGVLAAAASYGPARRAMRADPAVVLRSE